MTYDAIIIGSGFGGSMAAHALVEKGLRVLMIERGTWVERGPKNWHGSSFMKLTEHYTKEAYQGGSGVYRKKLGACFCVGGPSVYYGGVSLRFREKDFAYDLNMSQDARWPISYNDMEPFYQQAEEILQVSGCDALDPTKPPRKTPFPAPPQPLSRMAKKIDEAAKSMGLSPFPLPMAIHFKTCVRCNTCDAHACAISAKNDLTKSVLQPLLTKGMILKTKKIAKRLLKKGDAIVGVEVIDLDTRKTEIFQSDLFILAAGALATPQILLNSDVIQVNPAAHAVGRYLMRHCNAIIYGIFNDSSLQSIFHKQLAFFDFYHQSLNGSQKLGCLQQIMPPSPEFFRARFKWPISHFLTPMMSRSLGLLVIAEDQSCFQNRIEISKNKTDEFGLPLATIIHRYTKRDKKARNILLNKGGEILKKSGAFFNLTYDIGTFSHAVGTVRMGEDPNTSPLDPLGRFRGIKNLYITDGSAFPTSGGVNPSLTIGANALRIASLI